jgi:hypothetical protein
VGKIITLWDFLSTCKYAPLFKEKILNAAGGSSPWQAHKKAVEKSTAFFVCLCPHPGQTKLIKTLFKTA